jgi:hypothetical protein
MKNQKSEYDIQAEKFLEKFGIEINFKFLGLSSPKWEDQKQKYHNHYWVTVTRKGSSLVKPLEFEFFDSLAETQKPFRKTPSAYDILTCLSSDSYEYANFKDFCDNLGYNEDSRKDFKVWEEVQEQANNINAFFKVDEIEALREIQ